ncbi:MAG: MoaD/ThiS family protein, partial [Rariglobus sp.]
MTILYFAHARHAAGCDQEKLVLSEPVSATTLWDKLIELHPELAALRASSRFARDNEFIAADSTLFPEDEIAVIPPVSG